MKEREAARFERLELGYLRSRYSVFRLLSPCGHRQRDGLQEIVTARFHYLQQGLE
jgi:hypothetical protein